MDKERGPVVLFAILRSWTDRSFRIFFGPVLKDLRSIGSLMPTYLEIWPSVLFFYSPSNNSFWRNFTLCYLTIIIRFEILKAFIFFNCRYNFFCDTCGKQFCRPFELRRHMAVKHGEGEMPYPCDQCEKKFFEPKELRSHIAITHQGELNSEYHRVI